MKQVSVDFSLAKGRIKALHGVNNSPMTHGRPIRTFQEAGIPYVRLHDTMGAFGGTVYVDIGNIFTDFAADENDPANYHFEFTDAYLTGLTASGCKIFYRLGATIEHGFKLRRVNTNVPEDFGKWARICEHIIAHYNEGWANGFHMDIEYWEIWNEPENPPMWSGTREDYFQMYEITANHLKTRFPNIKVGGYAGCGFYCVTRENMGEFYESFMEWFDLFLERMNGHAPVDFFSWHLYTNDPYELKAHADYVADKLYEYGYYDTENIFNEWNYLTDTEHRWADMRIADAAAFVTAAFSIMQYGPIDKGMYYDARPNVAYGSLYNYSSKFEDVSKVWYAFKAFNDLYKLGNCVPATADDKAIFPIAAMGEGEKAILLSTFGYEEDRIAVEMTGFAEGEKAVEVYLLDDNNDLVQTKTEYFTADHAKLLLAAQNKCVYLIKIKG